MPRWQGRLVYGLAVMLVTAGLTHLGAVFALPYRSPDDAYAGMVAAADGVTLKTVSAAGASRPYRDAAMAEAFCLYDLRQGSVTASLDVTAADFVLMSVHGRHGRVFYGLTNRSATANRLALTVVTADQAARRPGANDGAAQDIRVEAGEPEGFVFVQWLAATPSEAREATARAARLTCATATPDTKAALR